LPCDGAERDDHAEDKGALAHGNSLQASQPTRSDRACCLVRESEHLFGFAKQGSSV